MRAETFVVFMSYYHFPILGILVKWIDEIVLSHLLDASNKLMKCCTPEVIPGSVGPFPPGMCGADGTPCR